MNKRNRTKYIVIFTLFFVATSIPLFAANTGTLAISGTVHPITSVVVTPDPEASNLPIGTTVVNLRIARVTELCNVKAGYTVTLSSANNGVLIETNGLDSLPYTLRYNGQPVVFTAGSAVISDVSSRTGAAGVEKELAISFSEAFLNADSYSDTLTFVITAK